MNQDTIELLAVLLARIDALEAQLNQSGKEQAIINELITDQLVLHDSKFKEVMSGFRAQQEKDQLRYGGKSFNFGAENHCYDE